MSTEYLADRLAIEDLFVRYATALDNGQVDTVVGCFTADAALESPAIGRIQGIDAIRAFAGRFATEVMPHFLDATPDAPAARQAAE